MKTKRGSKMLIYFICASFLMVTNGFPLIAGAGAKEKVAALGEMVSRGEVKYEARGNVWREVESSHFPLFPATKIKTEKGVAIVTLSDKSQIEVRSNSLFSLDLGERFILSRGDIEFRMPSTSETIIKVGNLSISRSRSLQAARNPSVVSVKDEEAMGSISIHSNGSVTVKSIQGKLSVLNQDQVVLAALSSRDSVTIPSVTVGGSQKVTVAQHGPTQPVLPDGSPDPLLGGLSLSLEQLLIIGGFVGYTAGIGTAAGVDTGPDHPERRPHCP